MQWTWSEHAWGKQLYSWILGAAYDFLRMKAMGEKEADEEEKKKC